MDFKQTNPAVLKSMFLQMDKATFLKNAQDCKSELYKQSPTLQNANYIFSLKNLLNWCRDVYTKRYLCSNKK